MANIDFEKYVKDLSPELQEKAKACKTPEELMKLADENDIELTQEALKQVSGGCGRSVCDKCGSKLEVSIEGNPPISYKICPKCNEKYYD